MKSYGGFAPNSGSPTFALTIDATAAGSILFAYAHTNSPGSSRAFDSNGTGTGTWQLIYDSNPFDGTGNSYWVCMNPQAGTTSVRATNGGTNSHFSVAVIEITGCDPAGAIYAAANHSEQSNVTAFASLAMVAVKRCLAVGISFQGGGDTPLGSMGTGFTNLSGPGLTSGNVSNTAEGDCTVLGTGVFAAGSVTAVGTWASVISPQSFVVGFDTLAPAITLTATVATSAKLVKQAKVIHTATGITTLAKRVFKTASTRTATAHPVAVRVAKMNATRTTSQSFVATRVSAAKITRNTISASSAVRKGQTSITRTAAVNTAATVLTSKIKLLVLTAVIVAAASKVMFVQWVRKATVSAAATIRLPQQFSLVLTAVQGTAATIVRALRKGLSSSTATAPVFTPNRVRLFTLTAVATTIATAVKQAGHAMTAGATSNGFLNKAIRITRSVSAVTNAKVSRAIHATRSTAVLTAAALVARRTRLLLLSATSSSVATQRRTAMATRRATVGQSATTRKSITHKLAASVIVLAVWYKNLKMITLLALQTSSASISTLYLWAIPAVVRRVARSGSRLIRTAVAQTLKRITDQGPPK